MITKYTHTHKVNSNSICGDRSDEIVKYELGKCAMGKKLPDGWGFFVTKIMLPSALVSLKNAYSFGRIKWHSVTFFLCAISLLFSHSLLFFHPLSLSHTHHAHTYWHLSTQCSHFSFVITIRSVYRHTYVCTISNYVRALWLWMEYNH